MCASKIHNTLLCSTLIFLFGCASASIEARPLDPQIYDLAAENTKHLQLQIAAPAATDSIGLQYVLLGLPLGRVDAGESGLMLSRLAYQNIALCGYRPILLDDLTTSAAATTSILVLKVEDLSATAYDLLFVRRLACHVSIKAKLGPTQLEASASKSLFRSTGFSKDLSVCVKETLDIALHDVLSQLGICTSDV